MKPHRDRDTSKIRIVQKPKIYAKLFNFRNVCDKINHLTETPKRRNEDCLQLAVNKIHIVDQIKD